LFVLYRDEVARAGFLVEDTESLVSEHVTDVQPVVEIRHFLKAERGLYSKSPNV
jgi:hypothetical protein